MLNRALRYAKDSYPVFPCCWPDEKLKCGCGRGHIGKSIGKVPLTGNGFNAATIEPKQIEAWWKRWPRANIGIAIPPGLFVLDVDIEHQGFESLSKMQNDLDFELTETWMVTTGSGGQHHWYKTEQTIRNTTRLGGYEGLDIRGTGGYVIVPPSLHRSGEQYETSPVWDGEITLAPPKLITLCLKSSSPVSTTPANGTTIYQEGERNDKLARDAGAMRRRGLSEQAIYAALQVTNQEKCSPPLPNKEVMVIAKSIGRYPPQSPRKKLGVEID